MRNSENQVPSNISSIQFELTPADNQRLVNLCGPVNKHLHQLEEFYNVKINCRSNQFEVTGEGRSLKAVKNIILTLYNVAGHETLSPATVQLYLNDNNNDDMGISTSVEFEDDSCHHVINIAVERFGAEVKVSSSILIKLKPLI